MLIASFPQIAACTVLAACASAMRLAKPNKLEQLLTLLPEEYIVEKINNDPKSTWTAGVNENLASIDIEDKIRALGTEVYTEAPFVCWMLLDCDVQRQKFQHAASFNSA
jgi:hypothetical protein